MSHIQHRCLLSPSQGNVEQLCFSPVAFSRTLKTCTKGPRIKLCLNKRFAKWAFILNQTSTVYCKPATKSNSVSQKQSTLPHLKWGCELCRSCFQLLFALLSNLQLPPHVWYIHGDPHCQTIHRLLNAHLAAKSRSEKKTLSEDLLFPQERKKFPTHIGMFGPGWVFTKAPVKGLIPQEKASLKAQL